MFKTKAKVAYYKQYCVAYVDRNIADYYRSLIPKYYYVQPPKYKPHITIVRLGLEHAKLNWGYLDGCLIDVYYDTQIINKPPYWFLDVFSEEIANIRKKLGLKELRTGFDCYHLTIGNNKNG